MLYPKYYGLEAAPGPHNRGARRIALAGRCDEDHLKFAQRRLRRRSFDRYGC